MLTDQLDLHLKYCGCPYYICIAPERPLKVQYDELAMLWLCYCQLLRFELEILYWTLEV